MIDVRQHYAYRYPGIQAQNNSMGLRMVIAPDSVNDRRQWHKRIHHQIHESRLHCRPSIRPLAWGCSGTQAALINEDKGAKP